MRIKFSEILENSMSENRKVILITGDLGYGVLDSIGRNYPDNFLNCGVAEQSMMSIAAGIASKGYLPFVYSIANFSTIRCLEQIRNDVANMDIKVCVVSVGAGMSYGSLGYSHYAVEDISIIRALQQIDIYSPADDLELELCMERIMKFDRPSYLRLGKGGETQINHQRITLEDELNIIRDGTDHTIVFTGSIGSVVIGAVQMLEKKGHNPKVISIPIINQNSISSLVRNSIGQNILVVEEHRIEGGLGSWILEEISDTNGHSKVSRLAIKKVPKKIGNHNYMLSEVGLTKEKIYSEFTNNQIFFRR